MNIHNIPHPGFCWCRNDGRLGRRRAMDWLSGCWYANGVDSPHPDGITLWRGGVVYRAEGGTSIKQVRIIGTDLVKQGFQLHGAHSDGSVAFRRKLARGEDIVGFLASRSLRGVYGIAPQGPANVSQQASAFEYPGFRAAGGGSRSGRDSPMSA